MISLRDIPPADWPATAARFRDWGYEQSLAYARMAAARVGGVNRFVAAERDGEIVAAACVRIKALPVLGSGIAYVAAGPMTRLAAPESAPEAAPEATDALLTGVLAALRRRFVEREGRILRVRFPGVEGPDPAVAAEAAAAAGFAPTTRTAGYRSFAIDLAQDMDAIRKGFENKWRARLKKALAAGLTLERGAGPDFQARFRRLLDEVQAAKGFEPGLPPEVFHRIEGPDFREDILIAVKDGEDVAGIVVGATGPTAVYLLGATGAAGRSLNAGYFLTWEAMALARGRGLAWYDMGGADKEANPSVHEFKKRMRGVPIEAAGPFEARPPGLLPVLVERAEDLRARLKGAR